VKKPVVVVGRERTGKILFIAQAYLTHVAATYAAQNAAAVGRVLTELKVHKRGK
jgi:hypothetical protein